MKNNRLTIGQMAKLNHTTLATLRLYDKKGLLTPLYVNPETGYRYYDISQCATFHMIQNQKDMDLSLKEIKEMLDRSDFGFLQGLYQKQVEVLKKQQQVLEQKQRALQELMAWTDFYAHRPPVDTCGLVYLPARTVFTLPAERDYFQEDFGSFLYGLSSLEDRLAPLELPRAYLYSAFLTLPREKFLRGAYQPAEIGVQVEPEWQGQPNVSRQESGLHACVYFEDIEKVRPYLDRLRQYCRKEGYEIAGDAICQLIGANHPQDFRKPAQFLRLQVPVEAE